MHRFRMFVIVSLAVLLLPSFVFAGPQSETTPASAAEGVAAIAAIDHFPEKVSVEYSTAFDVEYHDTYKLVTVSRPWPGAENGFTYLLVQRGTAAPSDIDVDQTVEVPIDSIVTMSTSYLPCLEELGVLDTLAGHETFAWVYSEAVRERIGAGKMKEVGSGQTVNVELLLELNPDLVMAYGIGNEWDTHPKLEEAGLPFVINAEWNEKTPIGRAEWIKYIALFYNKEAEANEYFDAVVEEYIELSELAASASDKPTVFMGTPYQGTWWMSGGGSFAAQLVKDAGADYVWSDDESTGSLMLDIETVFEMAGDAEYWVNTGYWSTLRDVKAADERFIEFRAYKTGMMYNNNLRVGPGGGNDYFESAPLRPNVVIADLISIFHPELLPDHKPYYYQKLE